MNNSWTASSWYVCNNVKHTHVGRMYSSENWNNSLYMCKSDVVDRAGDDVNYTMKESVSSNKEIQKHSCD